MHQILLDQIYNKTCPRLLLEVLFDLERRGFCARNRPAAVVSNSARNILASHAAELWCSQPSLSSLSELNTHSSSATEVLCHSAGVISLWI